MNPAKELKKIADDLEKKFVLGAERYEDDVATVFGTIAQDRMFENLISNLSRAQKYSRLADRKYWVDVLVKIELKVKEAQDIFKELHEETFGVDEDI